MINYVSTLGGIAAVPFDEAVLSGFAADGGLYVPESIPQISSTQLELWRSLDFADLAFEILSLYIDRSIIPPIDLKKLIEDSYSTFESPNVIDIKPLDDDGVMMVMELFHGPTLSFKDVAMGFLINVLDYLLAKRGERLSIVLATTGDTGPAAAWASAGKQTLDCWPLFPRGMITPEQERQMTTLNASNVHPVGVENCADGGDDLDSAIAKLFSNKGLTEQLKLSSVNSINWCRVMVQSVHYFYGYFRSVDTIGEKVAFSVPSGAFGNLFGGYLARSMGLPVESFICANNVNQALHTVLSTGVLAKQNMVQTLSSAIDIVIPYNFWRYLYFCTGGDGEKLRSWMKEFQENGIIEFDSDVFASIRHGFKSISVSDAETRSTIKNTFENRSGYLLDPHTAVAVAAGNALKHALPDRMKIICLATAHPAKFPTIISSCLEMDSSLPEQGRHSSLEKASRVCQNLRLCELENLEFALVDAMTSGAKRRH